MSVFEIGLVTLLRGDPDFNVLASGLDAAALERAAARYSPDLAILGEEADHQVIYTLKAHRPPVEAIVFLPAAPRFVDPMLGVTFLTWTSSPTQICAAVHRAASGNHSQSHERQPQQRPAVSDVLTKRERQVFPHLSRGSSYSDIAEELQISATTARSHTTSICKKLGLTSKRDLIGASLRSTVERPQ